MTYGQLTSVIDAMRAYELKWGCDYDGQCVVVDIMGKSTSIGISDDKKWEAFIYEGFGLFELRVTGDSAIDVIGQVERALDKL